MSRIDTSDIAEAGEGWFVNAQLVLPDSAVARTELENARAHLLICQNNLHKARAACMSAPPPFPVSFKGNKKAANRERAANLEWWCRGDEIAVLAALSWVWDAQERAGLNAADFWAQPGDIEVRA